MKITFFSVLTLFEWAFLFRYFSGGIDNRSFVLEGSIGC